MNTYKLSKTSNYHDNGLPCKSPYHQYCFFVKVFLNGYLRAIGGSLTLLRVGCLPLIWTNFLANCDICRQARTRTIQDKEKERVGKGGRELVEGGRDNNGDK
jgi:hypothetical protein